MSLTDPKKFWAGLLVFFLLLGGTMAFLCRDGFKHDYTFWSNDGPLGFMQCESAKQPGDFLGRWACENWIGAEWPATSPNIDALLGSVVSPEMFLKVFTPLTMLILGFGFWVLFRQLGFGPPACILGGLAAGLNMHFFSVACWGLGTWCLAAGMAALAMAALVSPHIRQSWARAILAGLAIGMCVMEGFDVGAILAVYVGIFLIFYCWITEENKARLALRVVSSGALMVLFSVLIAASTIWGLYGTQIVGVESPPAATDSDAAKQQAESQRWEFTTQWSTPKVETLGVFVSGLFGYRLQDYITDQDKSSAYWGSQGESPIIDQLESSDPKVRAAVGLTLGGPQVAQIMEGDNLAERHHILSLVKAQVQLRHTGSGEYAGIAVAILALLAVANSFRGERSLFSMVDRKMIWFFTAAAAISLVSAWGRYSFLYGAFWYRLPGITDIRNPMKFMHPFDIMLLILCGYGIEALYRRYATELVGHAGALGQRWKDWWRQGRGFDLGWALGSVALVAVAIWAFVDYNGDKPKLIAYLADNGFSADMAPHVADFSINQAFWGLFFLAIVVGVAFLLFTGLLSRKQAVIGWGLLAAILIVDLGRSDAPWIRYFDVGQKYSRNLIVDYLKDKPYERRIVGRTSPMGPYDLSADGNLGSLCHWWMENDFPYNNIQNLEIDQWPRMPEIDKTFLGRFGAGGRNLAGGARLWRLTNTRYILCDADLVGTLNQVGDPVNHSFHAIGLYYMVPKDNVPTITLPDGRTEPKVEDCGDLTFWPVDRKLDRPPISTNVFALVQYDSALPRTKLYSDWVTLDDARGLETVASPDFDISRSVVVSQTTPVAQPPNAAAPDPGSVDITDYHPKDVKLQADAKTPAVMLLNDHYLLPSDKVGKWTAYVDGREKPILRCNYIMRGVFLPAGKHTVEFRYTANLEFLYVTFFAFLIGFAVAGYVVYTYKDGPPPVESLAVEPEQEPKPQQA